MYAGALKDLIRAREHNLVQFRAIWGPSENATTNH